MRLFLLLIGLPLMELWLLIRMIPVVGGMNTLILVIATAAVGSSLLRRQGWVSLHRVQAALAEGRVPDTEVTAALLVLAGGLLLLTPGFITDAAGLAMMIPGLRLATARRLMKYLQNSAARFHVVNFGDAPVQPDQDRTSGRAGTGHGDVIDVSPDDYSIEDQEPKP